MWFFGIDSTASTSESETPNAMAGVNSSKNSNSFELFPSLQDSALSGYCRKQWTCWERQRTFSRGHWTDTQFRVMANPNDALLFWSDHAIQSDHARHESMGMEDSSQPRTDAIVPGLDEFAVLGAQREGNRDSRQG
jgi:hypothetical protein